MRECRSITTLLSLLLLSCSMASEPSPVEGFSPSALASSPDGKFIYAACYSAGKIARFDAAAKAVDRYYELTDQPGNPTGLTTAEDGRLLYVSCAAQSSRVCIIDVESGQVLQSIPAGHTSMAPVLGKDGKTLFVCNRFNDDVSILDLQTVKERSRVKVSREPVAAALTMDGKTLLVANHLPAMAANGSRVAAVVSVIDVADARVTKELRLPTGSTSVHEISVSPDGQYAVVTHILARFFLPTSQLDRGWMNTNAKTIIDLARLEILNTVLLDSVDSGAANPWGMDWTADGKYLVIAHAGTHEISVIDFPALLSKLERLPAELEKGKTYDYNLSSRTKVDVANDLAFLVDVRKRIRFPADRGPRAVKVIGTKAYVANYFSDSIAIVDITSDPPKCESCPLGPSEEMSRVRQGEQYFHDASICFQGWQSCSSCHPGEGRVDALNWDLLNDAIGNPKNTKSLLLAHATPPSMSLGVRSTAEGAVRAGIRHVLFSVQPDDVAKRLDDYLKALRPVPSPLLIEGQLSEKARRGEKIFHDPQVGCGACHPDGLFTDLKSYDVGTAGPFDRPGMQFDTPTLIEVWRTAPYLHDGSAANLKQVFTTFNRRDKHGATSHLSKDELESLVAYVLSL